MRRLTSVLVPLVASMASLSLVACGSDGSTIDVGAAPVTEPMSPSTVASSTVDTALEPTDIAPLLIDALPEISGPTVLWFWAPG